MRTVNPTRVKSPRRPTRRTIPKRRESVILDATRTHATYLPLVLPTLWKTAADDIIAAISGRFLRRGALPFSAGVAVAIPCESIAAQIYAAATEASVHVCWESYLGHEPGCLCVHAHILSISLGKIADEQNIGTSGFERMLEDNMGLVEDYLEERS